MSSSSASIIVSPSEDELPDSYSIMFELPTELDNCDLSAFAIVDQRELGPMLGESGTATALGGLNRPFLGSILFLDPTMGEDSGDDSANVE